MEYRCAFESAHGQAQVTGGDGREREIERRCDQRPHSGGEARPVNGDVAQRSGGAVLHRCQRTGQPHRRVTKIQRQRLERHGGVKIEVQGERLGRELDGRRAICAGQAGCKAVDLRLAHDTRGTCQRVVLRGHGIRDHRYLLDGLGVTGRFAVEGRSARDAGFGTDEVAHALLGVIQGPPD